ncbi:MAG: T9SS type A sorting domain-containing protein [Phaeodactylibacter sp.]|nr:T9SS type A sorting domain-containing protein [Phaeodactylibacter sp.]
MNRLLLLGWLLLLPGWGKTQISLTSAIFPEAGDTLMYARDNMPAGLQVGGAGGPYSWDFSMLQAPFATSHAYTKGDKNSKTFPKATLKKRTSIQSTDFYRIQESKVELLGTKGADPFKMGLALDLRYDPPLIEQRPLVRYRDHFQSISFVKSTFSADVVPKRWLDSLDLTPDSLRINTSITRVEVVDAFGTLDIPGARYEVLRLKRTDIIESTLEAKFAIGSWLDITKTMPHVENLRRQEKISYQYWNNRVKGPIAIAEVDPETEAILNIRYKSLDPNSNRQSVPSHQPSMALYPNPAILDVRVDLANLRPGNYKLQILNILGVSVYEQDLWIEGERTVKIDLNQLLKGSYLCSLVNSKDETLFTRRLIILRP